MNKDFEEVSPVNVWEEGAQAERRARAFPWEISGAEQSEGERKDIEGEGYLLQKTGCEGPSTPLEGLWSLFGMKSEVIWKVWT